MYVAYAYTVWYVLSDRKCIRNEALKVTLDIFRMTQNITLSITRIFIYSNIHQWLLRPLRIQAGDYHLSSRMIPLLFESCMSRRFAQYASDMPHIDLVLQLDCFRCWRGQVVRGPWVPTLISSTLAVERKTCITAVPDSDGAGGTTWVFVVWDYLDIAALALRSRVIYWIDHVYLFSVCPLFLSSWQARVPVVLTCRKGNLRASPSKPACSTWRVLKGSQRVCINYTWNSWSHTECNESAIVRLEPNAIIEHTVCIENTNNINLSKHGFINLLCMNWAFSYWVIWVLMSLEKHSL